MSVESPTASSREPTESDPSTPVSIIIPAHNEQASITRLLESLLRDAEPDEFELVVVCNGCTDATADTARSVSSSIHVVEITEPSKARALVVGDEHAHFFPRLYIDADVVVSTSSARALRVALTDGHTLASAPERDIDFAGASVFVRGYYATWLRLPQVQVGLFGRGVIAVSAAGHVRIRELPPSMSDDLAMSESFSSQERRVESMARVSIRPPRTLRDLLRRRIRVGTGNAQFDESTGRSAEAKTGWSDLGRIIRSDPRLIPSVAIFLVVTVIARIGARRRIKSGDFSTWLRDESSRSSS